jgi:hypothetical protein
MIDEIPITDDLGRVLDMNGKIVQVWCLPGTRIGTLSIVSQGKEEHLRGASLNKERAQALIRSLEVMIDRMEW